MQVWFGEEGRGWEGRGKEGCFLISVEFILGKITYFSLASFLETTEPFCLKYFFKRNKKYNMPETGRKHEKT